MERRTFIKLGAMAAAALGFGSRAEAKPDLTANVQYNAFVSRDFGGDGTGQLFIADPDCPRDSVYYYTRARFDLQRMTPYRNAPIHNIKVLEEPPDAL